MVEELKVERRLRLIMWFYRSTVLPFYGKKHNSWNVGRVGMLEELECWKSWNVGMLQCHGGTMTRCHE